MNAIRLVGGSAILAVACTLAPAAGTERMPARATYLVLDSRIIDTTDNARLAVGVVKKHPANPLFREDKPWEPRFDNLYANVLYDEQDKRYTCWYSPFIVDKAVSDTPREKRSQVPYRPRGREMGVCYAVSKDGLTWEKPDLGLIEFNGSKANNLVVRGPHGAGMSISAMVTVSDRASKAAISPLETIKFLPTLACTIGIPISRARASRTKSWSLFLLP